MGSSPRELFADKDMKSICVVAYEIDSDDQGRIVIPESLIKYSHLTDEIYFLGVGDRVEIWNKNLWDKKIETVVKDAPNYIDELINK